jgi:rubrerythrin
MEKEFKLKRFVCKRCDHKWIPRKEKAPKVCPGCNNAYYDRNRIYKKRKNK